MNLDQQTLSLFSALGVDAPKEIDAKAGVGDLVALMLNYRFIPEAGLVRALDSLTPAHRAGIFLHWSEVFRSHAQTTGTPVSPLYRAFPNHEILPIEARWTCFILGLLDIKTDFDPDLYGADPVTGFQNREFCADPARDDTFTLALPGEAERRELRELRLADQAFVEGKLLSLMSSLTPLSPAETDFVKDALNAGLIGTARLADLRFREKLPMLRDGLSLEDYAAACNSATDAMRLAAHYSKADLSLKSPVHFSLSKSQGKDVLAILEILASGNSDIETDMLRHGEAWKRFATHVRSRQRARRFPVAASLLEDLRAGRLRSWQSRFVNASLLDRIRVSAERPGVFARSVGAFLRDIDAASLARNTAPEENALLEKARDAFPRVDAPTLLQLHVYLERTLGKRDRFHLLPNGRLMHSEREPMVSAAAPLLEILEDHLHKRLDGILPWAPESPASNNAASRRFLPAGNRAMSDAQLRTARGDRMQVDLTRAPVLRLFLHWHHPCDVDLSVVFFGHDLEKIDDCSYMALDAGDYARHSGDILDGSEGAAEYVDITVDKAKARGVRYALVTANVYSGQPFSQFPAFVGMMLRDGKTGRHFEPETVETSMRLDAARTSVTPALLDLETGQLVYVDLQGSWRAGANVRNRSEELEKTLRFFLEYADYRPSIATVLRFAGTDGTVAITDAEIVDKRDEILADLATA